jgi:tetratricopeptide (TPR) repeat protein
MIIIGCAPVPSVRKTPVTEKDPFRGLPEKYYMQAIESEKKNEPQKALFMWKVVLGFKPGDREASERITYLKKSIQAEADEHFGKGVEHAENNSMRAARKEFLLALSYNPEYPQALHYLKNILSEHDFILYETKKGDTLKAIAEKVYDDADKIFLIAYFNDLDESKNLKKGIKLKMPVLEPLLPAEYASPDEMLEKAQILFASEKYEEAVAIANKILEYAPANREANGVLNDSYYALGIMHSEKKEYHQALKVFNKIEKSYKDVKIIIVNLIRQVKEQANIHYKRGIRHFLAEELIEAIKEWKITLQLDPDHPNAKKEIEKTRRMLEELRKYK